MSCVILEKNSVLSDIISTEYLLIIRENEPLETTYLE